MDKKVFELFALSHLLRRSRSVKSIPLPKELDSVIILSEPGKALLEKLKTEFPDAENANLYFALLLDLHNKDLWLDVETTDLEKLVEFADRMFFSRTIDCPWIYGRLLYDRFYEIIDEPTEFLSEEDTALLLEETPPGVAQVGPFVTGPFGLVRSRAVRLLFPEKRLPLWHCPDSGCNNLHQTVLSYPADSPRVIAHYLNQIMPDEPDEKKWARDFQENFSHRKNFYNDTSIGDIGALLGSCFSERELRTLACSLLLQEGGYIRSAIPLRGKYKDKFKGSAEKISSALTTFECVQLILLLEDEVIISALEELIHSKAIYLPPTEVRTPKLAGQGPTGWLEMYSELNHYGLRRVSAAIPDTHLAYTRLRRLVLDFYKQRPNLSNSLGHLLRFQTGDTLAQKLDMYLSLTDPRSVLEQLISIHQNGLLECLDSLNYKYAPPIGSKESEIYFINKILWKLGFDIRSYSDTQQIFTERLDLLLNSVRGLTNISEADRERTRSAAVNFFVSLEEVLDLTLAYSTWVFLSDHYAGTAFRFELTDGRELAHEYLNGIKIGKEKLEVRSDGRNTLFPLIEGIGQLGKFLKGLASRSSKKYLRDAAEVPGYSGKTGLEEFSFPHILFLFDIDGDERKKCFSALEETAKTLKAANVCDIRNRLEHKRKDFPTRIEVEECCDAVARCLKNLIDIGLCPTEFYNESAFTDSYFRVTEVYKSANNKEVSLYPQQYPLLSGRRPAGGPLNIISGITIGSSAAPFYSYLEYSSEYDSMWRDFPKRRIVNDVAGKSS